MKQVDLGKETCRTTLDVGGRLHIDRFGPTLSDAGPSYPLMLTQFFERMKVTGFSYSESRKYYKVIVDGFWPFLVYVSSCFLGFINFFSHRCRAVP